MKHLALFYEECICSKIRQCDLRAARISSRSHCSRRRAEINRAQAAYFEDNKERLIESMLRNGVGRDLAKINKSLIKAFVAAFPARAFSVESNGQYLSLLQEEKPEQPEEDDESAAEQAAMMLYAAGNGTCVQQSRNRGPNGTGL